MNPTLLPREQVAEHLAVSPRILLAFERRGLVRVSREGDVEGYPPAEVRRLWTVVSLHRDAGINLAGIEAVLRLREQLDALRLQMTRVAEHVKDALEADDLEAP
ncbi:MAG TPA: chaperone modulator CbpM [Isosphaeraceae bacterium]|nr:chaperone modulator CbpM [Isosphaeraceae bacterium]